MSTAKSIARNTSFLMLANILPKFLGLIFIALAARVLGVENFGIYSIVFAFVGLFAIIPHFGIDTLIIREIAREKHKAKQLLGDAFGAKAFLSFVMLLLLPPIAFVFGYSYFVILLIVLAGISLVFDAFAAILRASFYAFERMHWEFIGVFAYRLVFVSIGIALLLLGFGLLEIVLGAVAASLFNLLFSFTLAKTRAVTPSIHFNLSRYKSIIKAALPFCFAGIFYAIYGNIDAVMISILRDEAQVAFYSSALRLLSAMAFITAAFSTAVYPVMSRFFSTAKQSNDFIWQKSFKYLLIVSLPIAFGTFLLSERIIFAIFGKEFLPAAVILQAYIWYIVFDFLNVFAANALNSSKKEKLVTGSIATTVVINIVLNLFLITFYGALGAAVSTVISTAILFILLLHFMKKEGFKPKAAEIFFKPFIAALAMSLIVIAIQGINLFAIIPIAAIAYFAVLFLIKGFSKEDIEIIKKSFSL